MPKGAVRDFHSPMRHGPSLTILRASRAMLPVALIAIMAPVAAGAQGNEVQVLSAQPGSTLTIRGSTTIGARWSCRAGDVDSRVAVVAPPSDSVAIPEVRGVMIHVLVRSLRCQSGLMERSMRSALRADRDTAAQYIRGVFEIFDEVKQSASEPHLAGALKVAGVERNVFLRARVTAAPDGSLHVRSEVPMTLSAFSIEAPRVMWGAVRARDAVTVEVDLRFSELPATAARGRNP